MLMFVFGTDICFAPAAFAKQDEIYTSWRNNIAIDGMDAVSFHIGKPAKGKNKYIVSEKGALWKFASIDNMEKFMSAPEKYIPAYGGYCAWALAHGKLARGKAKHWTIKDGRLYFNFNKKIKIRWRADMDNYIKSANQHWPQILE